MTRAAAGAALRRGLCGCAIAMWSLALPPGAAAQSVDTLIGKPVTAVRVESGGRNIRDDRIDALLEIHAGRVLRMEDVRETIQHLMGLRRYLDVRVGAEADGAGVRVDIVLVPVREVRKIAFRGALGMRESRLRRALTDRFGGTPPVGRSADVVRTLEDFYASEGFLRASVRPQPPTDRDMRAGALVFAVDAGEPARIRVLTVHALPASDAEGLLRKLGVRQGDPYAPATLKRKLEAYAAARRKEGFFQARAESKVVVDADRRTVELTLEANRGLPVNVEIAGLDLPASVRAELVPLEREGSVDQDLLEDSERRIKEYLVARGYRDATVLASTAESGSRLRVVFTVSRGPLYRIADDVAITGAASVALTAIRPLVKVVRGQPFVRARLDADAAAVRTLYRQLGYADVTVDINQSLGDEASGERAVAISLAIAEGPKLIVRAITFEGREQVTEAQLRALISTREGLPYYQPAVDEDRDRLLSGYLNLGYRRAHVRVEGSKPENGTGTGVRFVIQEGPRVTVDRILVVGNDRISEATIRRELGFKPGDPLGDEAVRESRRRLTSLGLFRQVTISEFQHGQDRSSDVIVTVEEAPSTTISYGGGVEFQKVETSEFAPRAFFEIGRRNLWGKNRSVNLFGRLSFRRRDTTTIRANDLPVQTVTLTNLEYRIIGSYREPRFLGSRGDLQVSGVLEQGSRTSFRFRRRSIRADFGERLANGWSVLGQYSFERNDIFDDRINSVDRPLIDRLFPQVRLSIVSASAVRDRRDDPLDASKGSLISISGDLALRPLGSEVGLAKMFAQAFIYRQLPTRRRIVLAGGVRLGLATGFSRTVTTTDANGLPVLVTVRDLPANERFFAGGDTTVRGFQMDRLGRPDVFDRDGIPIGGHAEFILNAEVRIAVWKDFGVVGFVDYGNVFSRIADVTLGRMRASAGIGIRYKSLLGPLRLDLGWKLGALQSFGTYNERRTALHISIGQAF